MKLSHLFYPLPAGIPMGVSRNVIPNPPKTFSPSSGGALKSRPASHPFPGDISERTYNRIDVERWL